MSVEEIQKKYVKVQQTKDVAVNAVIGMQKKGMIISGIILCSIAGIFVLVIAVEAPSVNATNDCIDIDCLKEKLRQICQGDPKPEHLDCKNILRCIDVSEQEIMRCAKGYPVN
jgi:hypothetical protein